MERWGEREEEEEGQGETGDRRKAGQGRRGCPGHSGASACSWEGVRGQGRGHGTLCDWGQISREALRWRSSLLKAWDSQGGPGTL